MRGFVKFVLAIFMVIIGAIGIYAMLFGSFIGKAAYLEGTPTRLIIGLLCFILLLGGIYMLRK